MSVIPKAKVTKYFTKYFRNVPNRFILCGTPAPESELDYFSQCKFLDENIFKGYSYWTFRSTFFSPCGFGGHDWKITEKGKQYISTQLKKYCYMLKRSDVNIGGKKIFERKIVELPDNIRKIYNKCEKEFILYDLQDKKTLSTIYAMTRYVWLKRLCSGFIEHNLQSSHKIDTLKEILQTELKGEQVLIWAVYIDEVKAISDSLCCPLIYGDITPVDRETIRKDFQSGKHKYLVCQPETMKSGVKLSAASAAIYFSTPESALTREQSEDRILDLSSNKSSLIIDLCTVDTIEEDILMSLLKKEASRSWLNRLLRRYK